MKTIVLDGQTYELRPIEDKKPERATYKVNIAANHWNHSPSIDIYHDGSNEEAQAIRDAVEALMGYLFRESSTNYNNLDEAIAKAQELLEQ